MIWIFKYKMRQGDTTREHVARVQAVDKMHAYAMFWKVVAEFIGQLSADVITEVVIRSVEVKKISEWFRPVLLLMIGIASFFYKTDPVRPLFGAFWILIIWYETCYWFMRSTMNKSIDLMCEINMRCEKKLEEHDRERTI